MRVRKLKERKGKKQKAKKKKGEKKERKRSFEEVYLFIQKEKNSNDINRSQSTIIFNIDIFIL